MTRQVPQILYILGFILLSAGCAQVGQLTGGKRDTTPPAVIEAIPANHTVNFRGNEISIRFNEYIQVKDLNNQLIVSPLIKTTPEIKAQGKTLKIGFKKDELLPNTTYRFFLGNAVADMNESNSIPGFEFIFSTGPAIDSIRLKGNVTDAFNNQPSSDHIVVLHHDTRSGDSHLHNIKPDYMARTNARGDFVFKNLPPASFKVSVIGDKNKNLLYDAPEKVGFRDEPLRLTADSTIRLHVFEEEISKGFIKSVSSPFYGMTQLILNRRSLVRLRTLHSGDSANIHETRKGAEKDTVTIFYKNITDTLKVVLENFSFKKTDTLRIKLPGSTRSPKKLKSFAANTVGGKIPLNENLQFRFQTWMDTSRIRLGGVKVRSSDSLLVLPVLTGRWKDITTFEFGDHFKNDVSYTLKTDTGCFFDVYGISNDSMTMTFKRQNRIEFGILSLKLLFNKKQSYIIQLVNEQQKVFKEQFIVLPLSASNAVDAVFTDVLPGTYLIKIIFDNNGNKKWDTGDIIKRKQPEEVIIHSKPLKILADWEIEEEIQIKD